MLRQSKIGFLVALFLFLIGVLLYDDNFLVSLKKITPKELHKTSTGLSGEPDTSSWAIYKNNKFGYQFRYPKNLKVLNEEDSQPGFTIPIKGGSFIIFPSKYPNIKSIDPKDPKTFLNYTIGIIPIGKPEQYGKTINEIIQHFIGSTNQVTITLAPDGSTIAIYDDGARIYFISKNIIYNIYLEGFNPKDKYAKDWLENIGDPQLKEWANNYSMYSMTLKGIYSTFKIL